MSIRRSELQQDAPSQRVINGWNIDVFPCVLNIMSNEAIMTIPRPATPSRVVTWVGLFLALFSMIIIRGVFRHFASDAGPELNVLREALMFSSAGIVLRLLRFREGQPLQSIGLGASPWWKSVLWGLLIGALCLGVAGGLALLTHYRQGPSFLFPS
jgi:hypothetical protein